MHAEAPQVFINGEPLPWREGLDVALALVARQVETHAVATALNGEFIARERRAHTLLQPGDALTVFAAIVGG